MILEVRDLEKNYGNKKVALHKSSFQLSENICLGIIGRNGAGKSTLLKMIAGLLRPSNGEIIYFGRNEFSDRVKQKIGNYLGSEFLPDELSGDEFLELITAVYKLRPDSKVRKQKLLQMFFCDNEDCKRLIREYSFGMRQKIGICAALLPNPDLLLLDEPFTALDPFAASDLVDILNKVKKKHSIIVSSHDLDYLERICDSVIVLDEGKILYNNTLENFISQGKTLEKSLFNLLFPNQSTKNLNWL
jgi:ABC-type multidrug transport system ATPase subunit